MADKFTVTLDDGTFVCYINRGLWEAQGLDDDDLEHIKALHRLNAVHCLFLPMKADMMPTWHSIWSDIQYALQEAWGFAQNASYHKFWNVPHCSCPHVDNEDRYPSGYYVYSGDCPVHGYKIGGK